ncbi:hypothetical protein NW754_007788 [Fusarium falciforme]|nr:hypothetical protein NW754_007788 [Fusarium falciforme]KAJ4228785.1 hypothetical protein NW757_014102 [Fusarium falciforme]
MRFSAAFTAIVALPFGVASTATLPLLKLPYGTWRASDYNAAADFYTFRNIRYAAPPVGSLRFARPQPPQPVKGIQDGSYGHVCPQVVTDPNNGEPPPGEGEYRTDIMS